jgi:hypothetical protein
MPAPVASGWSEPTGGPCTHWKAPPFHGARRLQTFPPSSWSGAASTVYFMEVAVCDRRLFAFSLTELGATAKVTAIITTRAVKLYANDVIIFSAPSANMTSDAKALIFMLPVRNNNDKNIATEHTKGILNRCTTSINVSASINMDCASPPMLILF